MSDDEDERGKMVWATSWPASSPRRFNRAADIANPSLGVGERSEVIRRTHRLEVDHSATPDYALCNARLRPMPGKEGLVTSDDIATLASLKRAGGHRNVTTTLRRPSKEESSSSEEEDANDGETATQPGSPPAPAEPGPDPDQGSQGTPPPEQKKKRCCVM
eukprot:TRINITY_DN9076_c0_g1_i1.p1 TRINITY_DN9076_c0_g1~~TRINITY_DN9076_c0_g1_i1.p1  ORF type:complete len:161 (+),score=27.43 TRINITY_DN9076_c0_g1_i1:432-914(+)